MSEAFDIAARSLRANIMRLPSGPYLTAGQHQFKTLWTRDFCHAVGGLLALNEDEVARNHLSYLLKNLRPDGLVPRVVDNRLVQFRVAWQSARELVKFLLALKFQEPLRAQYVDEHGSHAVDSNLLVILAALKVRAKGGEGWWRDHGPELRRVWAWYGQHLRDGLVWQTPFADWQDSVKREGHTLLTNLFYFLAGTRLRALGWEVFPEAEKFRGLLKQKFFDPTSGLYLSLLGRKELSLDGNLLAIEAPEFLSESERRELWQALKRHPLVAGRGGIMGVCGTPDWPLNETAWHVKFARLERYHGSLAWSWLVGWSLKVGQLMQDHEFCQRQRAEMGRWLKRDGQVVELYDPELDWRPWGSWLLKAERPFAWGSGYMVESLINAEVSVG